MVINGVQNIANVAVIPCIVIVFFKIVTANNDFMARRTIQPSTKLYVGNLSPFTKESDLMEAFDGCVEVRVILHPQTGDSLG